MRLSCIFIQIEELNLKFPEMTLIRLKNRHFILRFRFYICQSQPKLTGDVNFGQTAETYFYT